MITVAEAAALIGQPVAIEWDEPWPRGRMRVTGVLTRFIYARALYACLPGHAVAVTCPGFELRPA